jgi:hypothetical protein
MESEARYQINHYQVGMYGHWLNKIDGELYKGQIVGMVHDQTNGDHRINITLATDFGFITIRVF